MKYGDAFTQIMICLYFINDRTLKQHDGTLMKLCSKFCCVEALDLAMQPPIFLCPTIFLTLPKFVTYYKIGTLHTESH